MTAVPGGPGAAPVIYVTAQLPYGATEPFVAAEIAELERQGCRIVIVPVRTKGAVVHGDARSLLPQTIAAPLLSGAIVRAAVAEAIAAPAVVGRALLAILRGDARILLKNLSVFPKALWLARQARRLGARHLHAHWASTPATLAMLASRVSGVPWSFTAHRWDIAEDNLLALKVRDACFVRAISEHGAEELRAIVGDRVASPWVLHMGVALPAAQASGAAPERPFRILTAARFVEKKGHVHLLAALVSLKERGVSVRAELAGEGPLGPSLRRRTRDLGLEGEVAFLGNVPHEELVRGMAEGRWHAAVLPSVVTPSGELEGIPVSLIEAMACGLPAIGTDAGGTPELLRDGAGLLVAPEDSEALAEALAALAGDPAERRRLAHRGRRRVEESFASARIAASLQARFRECGDRRRAVEAPPA